MAIVTYRYRWIGLNVDRINRAIPKLGKIGIPDVKLSAVTTVDMTVDDVFREDLDDAMLEQGWEFDSQV